MVYEVCALVLTIVFSMVGVYIVIVLHATKGLVTEARQVLKTVKENLPKVLSEIQCTVLGLGTLTETVRISIEQVGGKIFGPLRNVAGFIDVVKLGFKIWRIIRKEQSKTESAKVDV
ncbi:MAG: hypothetical protein ACYDEJ_07485 [Desulfitobacteriaceae bacterium]